MEDVLSTFFAPLPRCVAWLARRQLNKHANNPQIAYLAAIKGLNQQGLFAALQAITFLGFLVAGFIFAAAI